MRFSYRKYPLLKGFNFDFTLRDDLGFDNATTTKEEVRDFVRGYVNNVVAVQNTSVSYVSKTFIGDCILNQEKFPPIVNLAWNNRNQGKGYIYITTDGSIYVGAFGVFYAFFRGKRLQSFTMIYNNKTIYLKPISVSVDMVQALPMGFPLLINEFKTLASIKTKTLDRKKKMKEFHCKYTSDFDFPIELLTENWYTESCRDHPFVVRGHWRMQPYGKDRSSRRLIYIDSFMKKKYNKGPYKTSK